MPEPFRGSVRRKQFRATIFLIRLQNETIIIKPFLSGNTNCRFELSHAYLTIRPSKVSLCDNYGKLLSKNTYPALEFSNAGQKPEKGNIPDFWGRKIPPHGNFTALLQ
jgi:hypothetical protein